MKLLMENWNKFVNEELENTLKENAPSEEEKQAMRERCAEVGAPNSDRWNKCMKNERAQFYARGAGSEEEYWDRIYREGVKNEELEEEEKMNIGKMHLKKGRCKHMGSEECPEGSPQYNLAKRFKSGDIHKANLKKGKNPHGPG